MPSSPVVNKKCYPLDASCATNSLYTETYLFGGVDGEKYSNTLYRFSANKLTPDVVSPCMEPVEFVIVVSVGPIPRIRHAMTLCYKGVLISGGKSEQNHTLGDIWCYSLQSNKWERVRRSE